MDRPSLFGRERERALIRRVLDDIQGGGRAMVIEGEAGIGKSALLSEAIAVARDREMLVLGATGVQSETNLPFAGLHQLLRPVLSRLADLPAPQREALDAAFGMGYTVARTRFLIALGALGLLSDVAAGMPIELSIEDAHWLDRATAEVLAFIGRRLESDPIVMVVAIREGYESALHEMGLTRLNLDRLDDAAVEELLRARLPALTGPARQRLIDEAEGNPLALLELGAALSDARYGDAGLRFPLTTRLERAFAARAAELPAAARTVLVVAAADEDTSLSTVLAAAGLVDGAPRTVEHLVPATQSKLIEVDGQEIRFRHPLVRSAIYQTASLAERHAVHLALAGLLDDDLDRSVWHRAAAAVGPDPAVASALEEAGLRAQRRGAVTTAAAAFERAAALTRETAQRRRLLLAAAAAASDSGHGKSTVRLLRETDKQDLGPHERGRWMLIEDSFHDRAASDPARVRELTEAASEVAVTGGHDLAMELLMAAANRCYWGNLRDEGREVVRAAEDLGRAADDQRLLFIQAFAATIERGGVVLQQAARSVSRDDPGALYLRGMAVCLTGAFERALPLLNASARRLREQGRLRMLAQVLEIRAWAALEVADFGVAIPSAEEAGRLSSDTGHPLWETTALVAQATIAALRGDRAGVERITAEVGRIALPIGAASLLSLAQYARGLMELGEGRHAEAYEQLRRISSPGDPACHDVTACHSIGDLAEAAAHSGHREAATALMQQLEAHSRTLPSSWFHAQTSLARVHLAEDGSEGVFDVVLKTDLAAYPMIRARIELAYGEWLRRHRRRRESRAPLRAARDTFDALGVTPWAERARRELRASGESSRRRAPDTLDELTPQELQIVQMAAHGLSNREIAQQLYLSHRTVESHLYRTFPKLGITSRAQLVATLGARLGAVA